MKFSVLSCLILLSSHLSARESFEFNLGKKVNILSDKAFRKASDNTFEAVGNVVITHLKNAIYGEKAKVNFNTGEVEVVGNVRYIAPEMTLYGTRLYYNVHTEKMEIENARVQSDNYIITGKEITRPFSNRVFAKEAEYTTCQDCPESWSIFGKEITIDVGEYIHLKHAFVKVKGVIVMYFPYLVFPIKQKRETGFLFPLIGSTSNEGFRFQQPFFWAIDDYKDLTVMPSTFGKRGFGGQLQYRQSLAEKTWIELNTLGLRDKIYEPFKVAKTTSGNKENRYYGEFEGHFIKDHNWNGHILMNNASDLDMIRDLDFFTNDRLTGTELGGGGFLERRGSLFNISVESYFNQNMLYNEPRKFDHQYVQMLPKISFSTVPYNLLQTDKLFFRSFSLGLESDYTIFKQNHATNAGDIRNARRLNLSPYINWQLGNVGPILFSHKTKFDYQNYVLPHEKDRYFYKSAFLHETEARIELEKNFGLAYIEEVPRDIKPIDTGKTSTIGELPAINNRNVDDKELIYKNSYRHVQELKLKHYYLGKQNSRGNEAFANQIESDDGQFDYIDAYRGSEYKFNQNTAYDSLPITNTLELRWDNSLIRKKAKKFDPFKDNRYLKDNFDYRNIAYLDVSQGIDLNVKSDELSDKLTRLYLKTGIDLDRFGVSAEEFYFHQAQEHKFTTAFHVYLDRFTFSTKFTYNSFNSQNTPVTKLLGYNFLLNVNDLIILRNQVDYNFKTDRIQESLYAAKYAPLNNCWQIEVTYSKDLIESKVGIILYINYNDNNFTGINVK